MTARRFWRYWLLILVLETWLILSAESDVAPPLVRPRAAHTAPELPELPPREATSADAPPSADAMEVESSHMWGAPAFAAAPGNTPPAKPNWSLAGVYGRGEQTRVIVRFEEDRLPIQELKTGEPLPSGDVIAAIETRRVCVLVGRNKQRRWLPINAIAEVAH